MRWLLVFLALGLFAQDDQDAAHHAQRAAAAMKSGDYATAEQENRLLLRLNPSMPEAEMNLGLSCFLQKKYDGAIQAFEAGLKLRPDMDGATLFAGISYLNLNQTAKALPLLKQYATRHPDDFQGTYHLGLCYLSMGKFAEAESALRSASALEPENVDVLYHLTETYLGQARRDPSRQETLAQAYQKTVERIAAIDPNSFRLGQLRAAAYEADGKNEQAIAELEKLLEHDPKARGLHYTLGCLYIEQHQYEKALSQLRKELDVDSPFPRTYLQLGHVYVELQQPAAALPLLDKALQSDASSGGMAWAELGRAYREMNQFGKSETAYQKAISLGHGTANVYYQLSTVAKRTGNVELSREALAMSQKLRAAESKRGADTP